MFKIASRFLLVLLLVQTVFVKQVVAAESPDVMLNRITKDMLTTLRDRDDELRTKPNLIFEIIDKILVPHVDSMGMARWVAGRHAWSKANQSQRIRFANEFRDLLIRTYASTLIAYNNQTVEYLPIRGDVANKRRVQVNSLIREPGKDPIKVAYRLISKANGWKVYDISIEGVSLLKGFQSQFSTEIQQKGIESVIKRIQEHNKKPLS